MRKSVCLIVSGLLLAGTVFPAKKKDVVPPPQKSIAALRTESVIKVDGILDELVWQREGRSDFLQSDPHDGSEPTEKTEIWVAYDDDAIYVAARLHDSEPEKIVSRLGRRDEMTESDWFFFAVDPYYDRRSGYQFGVNPSGCIIDWTLYNDNNRDTTWDGVWDCGTKIDEEGWTVEIKVPYHQLRFSKQEEYIWGVNFRRHINRKNESVGYVWVPKEIPGFVSHFARLDGVTSIKPGRHIEIMPYTVGQAHFSPEVEGDPFRTGKDYLGNIGFDMKVGLSTNLTLDLSVNPDFGQVEVDPAVINLSAYETYFQEKRPFFIEGNSIFDNFGNGGVAYNLNVSFPNPTLFYSRRIGRAPQGYVTQAGYADMPDRSTILSAVKLTGRVDGWKLGVINAFTAREYARIDQTGTRLTEEVQPFSNFGVIRALREFTEGHSGLGFMATTAVRDLRTEGLRSILANKAFTLAVDGWSFLDKKKDWIVSAWLGGTYVSGSSEMIGRLQRSSLHYYQRPDVSHVSLKEGATSLSGWGGRLQINKQRGNTIFNFSLGALSPGFDPNDLGFQPGASDIINVVAVLGQIWPHPGKLFRMVILAGGPFRNYDFGGNKIWDGVLALLQGQFLNYWDFNFMLAYNPKTVSHELTRGGPLVEIPYGYQVDFSLSTDVRKPINFGFSGSTYQRPAIGSVSHNLGFSIRWKPKSNISFSAGPGFYYRLTDYQWVRRVGDSLMTETYGARYVFGRLEQKVLSAEIRLNWIFTPKLSLQAYLQPYLAVGVYDQFKELARAKSQSYNLYGENGSTVGLENGLYTIDPDGAGPAQAFGFYNPDFNYKSMRGTVVLRWEYHPGSVLFFVWTQNRMDFANPGDLRLGRDLGDLFTAPGDNIFLFKFSYRWNM
jgi:hypothetical protein